MTTNSKLQNVVPVSTFSAEEIANAKAIVAQVEASQSVPLSTDSTALCIESNSSPQPETPLTEQPVETATVEVQELEASFIDADCKARIEALFASSISDPRFWSNPKRIERLETALAVPLFDNRSLQQFAISAEDELIKAAMELACKTKSVPVMPTEGEITALAEAKYAAKQQKDAAKAAKAPKVKA